MKGFVTEGDLARRVRFSPAWDCVQVQPCVKGVEQCRHGRHGVEVAFDLVGPGGAVTFVVFSGWYVDATPDLGRASRAGASHISLHLPEQEQSYFDNQQDCDLLPEGRCWGDVTFTGARTPWRLLREEGEDAMWAHLATWLPGNEQAVPA